MKYKAAFIVASLASLIAIMLFFFFVINKFTVTGSERMRNEETITLIEKVIKKIEAEGIDKEAVIKILEKDIEVITATASQWRSLHEVVAAFFRVFVTFILAHVIALLYYAKPPKP